MRKAIPFMSVILMFLGVFSIDYDHWGYKSVDENHILLHDERLSHVRLSSVGPDGGTITSVAIDPEESQILYAGTWGNGVYKSHDRGLTWLHKSSGLQSGFIYDVAINPQKNSHLLASVFNYGVYESIDGGDTWQPTFGMPEQTVVYSIKYQPSNPDIVYAAVRFEVLYLPEPFYSGGVYKSIDAGKTWVYRRKGLPEDYVYDIAIDPRYPNILYAATHESGIYKSIDEGKHWFSINYDIHSYHIRSIDVNPHNSDVYVGLWRRMGVAYLKNESTSWTKINATFVQKLSVYELQLDPINPQILYLSTSPGLYKCVGDPYLSENSKCDLIAHENNYVLDLALDIDSAGTDGKIKRMYTGVSYYGLYESSDAGFSFHNRYAGIKANEIVSVLSDPNNPSVVYASIRGNGIIKSNDEGLNWIPLIIGLPNVYVNKLVLKPDDSNTLFAATMDSGIYISDNGGSSWSPSNDGLPVLGVDADELVSLNGKNTAHCESFICPEILSVSFDPSFPCRIFIGTNGYGMMVSEDCGKTWHTTSLDDGIVRDLLIDNVKDTRVFIVAKPNGGVAVSYANTDQWILSNNGLHDGADIYGLTRAAPGCYFAATDKGVYKTINSGELWEAVGLVDYKINDVFVDEGEPDVVWAATTNGLYQSFDGGHNWLRLDLQELNGQFNTIAPGFGRYAVYVGTAGGNVYCIEP